MSYTLWNEECLEAMKRIPDGSVDMVMCDLPYGTTACKWDTIIPFDALWAAYRRVCKKKAAIVLTASQPFTSALVMSNPAMFKYEWIWEKDKPSNFALANKQPMKYHESITVFSFGVPAFNKIMVDTGVPQHTVKKSRSSNDGIAPNLINKGYGGSTLRFPGSIQKVSCVRGNSREKSPHPTQKPVALMEYLIKTYTHPGDMVLDNCMGSGTTGVACMNLGRRFIGIEKDVEHGYFQIAEKRISEAAAKQEDWI